MTKLMMTENGPAIHGKSAVTGKPLEIQMGTVHFGTFASKGRYETMSDVREVTILAIDKWLLKGTVPGIGEREVLVHPRIGDTLKLRGSMSEAIDEMNKNRLK